MVIFEEEEIEATYSELVKRKPNVPGDMVFEVLTRLPVRSALRFRSVSRSWGDTIHSKVFADSYLSTKLEDLTERYLLIEAYKKQNSENDFFSAEQLDYHFLSASCLGGPTKHILTLPDIPLAGNAVIEQVNGIVLFSSKNGSENNFMFFLNPSTHEVLNRPGSCRQSEFSYGSYSRHFLGFDPDANDFKVLHLKITGLGWDQKMKEIECGIFNLTSLYWKSVDVGLRGMIGLIGIGIICALTGLSLSSL